MSQEDRTPPASRRQKFRDWADVFTAPHVKSWRLLALSITLGVTSAVEGLIILNMLPLKERIPYFVEVDRVSGQVTATNQAARQFKPEERHLRYFLKVWVENLMTIDQRSREFLLPASYSVLRGTALKQWQDWVDMKDQPLKKLVANPSYRREVGIASISFVSDGVALIRVTLTGRNGTATEVTRHVITVNYALLPPINDEEAFRNPLGMNITGFVVNDELI